MKSKTLVKSFAYDELLEECKKQGWRLPTLEEAKNVTTHSDCFFIEPKTEIFDDRLTCVYYPNSNSVGLLNRNFKVTSVVMKEDQFCVNCVFNRVGCIHPLNIGWLDISEAPEKWGCTEFKRRVE